MDPFSLLLSISNLIAQWVIGIGVCILAATYIYRSKK